MLSNPFTPTFGVTPPLLVGRDAAIEDFSAALDDGPGSAGRATLITGARGVGKTVLLNALEEEARDRSWSVLTLTTRPGMVDDATNTNLPQLLEDERLAAPKGRTVGSVNVSVFGVGGGFSLQPSNNTHHAPRPSFESLAFNVAEAAGKRNAGLLITVDEAHREAIRDLQIITQTIQHGFRRRLEIAIALAGLPSSVEDLLNDNVLTFVRRAERYRMANVNLDDVREAIQIPLERSGRKISEKALKTATEGTQGYPYLIQSIGSEMWRLSRDESMITSQHAEQAVETSIRKVGSVIHDPELSSLSGMDKSYLVQMARDERSSRSGDIAKRLGVSAQYANVYRDRLLRAGLISAPQHGVVEFTTPYLREYLRDHVALTVVDSPDSPSG